MMGPLASAGTVVVWGIALGYVALSGLIAIIIGRVIDRRDGRS